MDIIAGSATQLATDVIASLANYRYKVFVEQLGWQLDTPEGIELDQFDRPDTLYVVARNHAEEIIGCARLLPTTTPYLLEEI
ncbi:MAG: GNAT family N-acetyltransferase, partial [Methylococcales bacterium]|nr:GNAT family N-acetyltransferase [Methylococcales bacterium]